MIDFVNEVLRKTSNGFKKLNDDEWFLKSIGKRS